MPNDMYDGERMPHRFYARKIIPTNPAVSRRYDHVVTHGAWRRSPGAVTPLLRTAVSTRR